MDLGYIAQVLKCTCIEVMFLKGSLLLLLSPAKHKAPTALCAATSLNLIYFGLQVRHRYYAETKFTLP